MSRLFELSAMSQQSSSSSSLTSSSLSFRLLFLFPRETAKKVPGQQPREYLTERETSFVAMLCPSLVGLVLQSRAKETFFSCCWLLVPGCSDGPRRCMGRLVVVAALGKKRPSNMANNNNKVGVLFLFLYRRNAPFLYTVYSTYISPSA